MSIPAGSFTAYIPDFDYLLYDSTREDPEAYDFNDAVKALLTIWHYSHRPEFVDALSRVFHMIRKLDPGVQLRDFLGLIMQYLYIVRGEDEYIDIEKIARDVIPEEEEIMETLADQWIQEGESRGFVRGEIKTTQSLILESLAERFDVVGPGLTEKIKTIESLNTLQSLFRQTHRVGSIENFKALVDRALED